MPDTSRESESDSVTNDGSKQQESQDNSSNQDLPERNQSPPPQVQQLSASQTGPQTVYSESLLSDYKTSTYDKISEVSNAAMSSLIEQKVQFFCNSLGEAQASWMKKQSEMLEKINKLETSEKNLKNQVKQFENQNENVVLNNKELIDKVEEVREENAGLFNRLNEMELSGQIKKLEKEHKTERDKWRSELNLWRLGMLTLVLCIFATTSLQQSFAETLESNFWRLGIVMLVLCIFVTTSLPKSFAETLETNLKNEIEQRQNLELKISEEFTQLRQQIDTERSNEAQKTDESIKALESNMKKELEQRLNLGLAFSEEFRQQINTERLNEAQKTDESIKALESNLRNEIGKKRDKTDAMFTLADQLNGLDFYFGDDKFKTRPSIKISREDRPFSIKSIFQAVDLGLKRINLKFHWEEEEDIVYGKWRVRSLQFKASEGTALTGENWKLFISNSDRRRKFRATAENIHPKTGNVTSKIDGIVSNSKFSQNYGQEEIVTTKFKGTAGYIRWNIEFLD